MRHTRFKPPSKSASERLRVHPGRFGRGPVHLASLCMLLASILSLPYAAKAEGRDTDGQAETCRLGTYTYAEFDRAAALQPLADWLQAHTGCAWQVEVLASPGALADEMAAGHLDWAVPNLVGHLRALQKAPGLHAGLRVAVPPADGVRYRSLLLVRADSVSDLQTLKSMAHGLRLGLTFADSASGGLVPATLLASVGLDAHSDFATLRYTGRHDASLDLLVAGEVDLIGLPADLLPAERRAEVTVLAESAPIPVGAMLCGGRISPRCAELTGALRIAPDAARIARALAQAWPEFGAAAGFELASAGDYAALLSALPVEVEP